MVGFTEFKNSIVANYELIVKALVGKLKKGDIVVAKAESAVNATTAEKAIEASTSLDASKLGGKTLADIIELLKNSSEQTFETLSQNLKGYDTKNEFYQDGVFAGKLKRMTFELDGHTFFKDYTYFSNGRLDSIVISSTSFEISTLISKNKKTLTWDLDGNNIGKIYSTV